jgi:hypothetical protein
MAVDNNHEKDRAAHQHRRSDVTKGFVQAIRVRDSIAEVATAIDQARLLITKAQEAGIRTQDRRSLDLEFARALSAIDHGANDQLAALADSDLTNAIYQKGSVAVVAIRDLGRGVSPLIASCADLKCFRLIEATPEQLIEVASVLDAADREVQGHLANAEALERLISSLIISRLDAPGTRQAHNLDAELPTGSMFNGIG